MNAKITTFLLSILIIISAAAMAYAGDTNEYAYTGRTTFDVNKIAIGARPAAMGGAFTALANDINSGSFNPAGYAFLNYKTVSASHNEWLANSNYSSCTFGLPYGKGTFVAGLTYFDEGTVREVVLSSNGVPEKTGRELGAHDFQASLGYATRVNMWLFGKMYMGMNARFLQYTLAEKHRGAFFGDIGFIKPIGNKFTLGLSLLNLGTGIGEMPAEDDVPPTVSRIGLGANRIIDTESFAFSLGADMVVRKPLMGADEGKSFDPQFNVGGELWIYDMFALRGGYKINYDLEKLTLGAGFNLKDYAIDYAFVDMDDEAFDATHRLTATMTFGTLARADRDGDGIPDDVDRCPDEPEDFDHYEDADGCPDYDNDRDGIFDEDDKCPNMPEFYNGYDDEDGCPDVQPIEMPVQEQDTKGHAPTGAAFDEDCLYCEEDPRGFYYLLGGYDYVRPILFETDQYAINPESKPALERIATILDQCFSECDAYVEIRGHADERGGTDYNLELSEKRANAVREYMINNYGLPADKLVAVGAGEDEPLMPKDMEKYYQFNRRVVFRVIKQGEE